MVADPFDLACISVIRSLWRELRTGDGPGNSGDRKAAVYSRLVGACLKVPPLYRLAAGGTVTTYHLGRRPYLPSGLRERIGAAADRVLRWIAAGGRTGEL